MHTQICEGTLELCPERRLTCNNLLAHATAAQTRKGAVLVGSLLLQ